MISLNFTWPNWFRLFPSKGLSLLPGEELGGIKLNKPATEICVIDIIQAINGSLPDEAEEICIFGLEICTDSVPCPIHDVWKGLKENIKGNLHHQNLESLTKELNRKHKILGSK